MFIECVNILIRIFSKPQRETLYPLAVPPYSCPLNPPLQFVATTNLPCLYGFAYSGHFT